VNLLHINVLPQVRIISGFMHLTAGWTYGKDAPASGEANIGKRP